MAESRSLTHLDENARAKMVDISEKPMTSRRAVAAGRVRISPALAGRINANTVAKGNLLEVARLAGIAAAKQTYQLIPLCHSIPLDLVQLEAWVEGNHIQIRAEVRATWKTGVEMEALTAVAVAALTVIDMGKAIDKEMVIEEIRLIEKTGGKSGDFHAAKPAT